MILRGVLVLLSASFVLSRDLKCSIFTPDYKTKSEKGCSYYWECEDGVLEEKKCWFFQKFSPSKGQCQSFGVNCSEEEAGIPEEWEKPVCYEGLAPYNTYSNRGCKYFYTCENGTLTESTCSLGMDFDPVSKKCRFSWDVNCTIPETPLPTSKPARYNLTCDETTQEYSTVSEKGCNYYYQCKGGYLTEEKCWFWQDFDPATGRCLKKDYVNCSAQAREVPKPWKRPQCSAGLPDFTAPHPWGCRYYFECKDGALSTKKCSAFRPKFNPEKHACDLSWRVDCNEGEAVCREGRSPSEKGPRFYKTCVEGVTKERECPNGEVFHPDAGTCLAEVLELRSDSRKRPECNMATPNYKTVVQDRKDCTHYYQCEDGKLSLEKCWPLSYFDPSTSECVHQILGPYDCSATPKDLPETWTLPDCDGRPDFKTPSPWGCKYYLQCQDSLLSTQTCPIGRKFDPSKSQCSWSADCKARPSPTPGTTTYRPLSTSTASAQGGGSTGAADLTSSTETTPETSPETRGTSGTTRVETESTADSTTTEWTTPGTQEY